MAENRVAIGLERVCVGVVEEFGLCGATVTVMTHEGAEVLAAASGVEIRVVAELQFAQGEGPTRDAFQGVRPVLVPDLTATDGRWIGFAPAALDLGITGVYAFPLGMGALRLGVLTCYAAQRRALAKDELDQCLVHADAATELLLSSSAGGDAHEADPEVQESLHIRSEVYQAQGMLTVELGVSLADAMARLRAMAFAEDVDINVLATDLISGRRPFPGRDADA